LNITSIATDFVRTKSVPRIGCGLDGLEWSFVETCLKNAFAAHPDIELVVYTLPSEVAKYSF
jgi:hypothetical protein